MYYLLLRTPEIDGCVLKGLKDLGIVEQWKKHGVLVRFVVQGKPQTCPQ